MLFAKFITTSLSRYTMRYCVKMYRKVYALLFLSFAGVHGVNDVLRGTQPLYGVATLSDNLGNGTCGRELDMLQRAVDEKRVWAIKAMDASGRPGTGFIYGNNLWIGSHAQCQDISNTKKFEINYKKITEMMTSYDFPPYPMGFSMVYIRHNSTLQHHTQLPLEWTIQLGFCMPKSCSKEDILYLTKIYFDGEYLEMQKMYHMSMDVSGVKPLQEDIMWFFKLPKTIILFVICGVIIMLTIMGTVYDMKRHNMEKNLVTGHNTSLNGKSLNNISTIELVSNSSSENLSKPKTNHAGEILKCFSIYSNTKNLMKTKLSPESVGCIHGLRFLGMLWVIGVHAIYFQADFLNNVPTAYRLSESIFSQILSNSTYCVDTYLFLSGFLVTYLFYKAKNPHEPSPKNTNVLRKITEFFMMYVNRFARLTPPYLLVILFTDVVYTLLRQVSSLTSFEAPDIVCEKYWWRNLFYINNLFPRSEMCLSWSWYLSLDTQFFTITTFLLILSLTAFKLSAAFVCLLIVINVIATAYKSYSIGYIPTMDEQLAQLDAIYDLPWNRIGAYLIGVITGYILTVRLQQKLILSKPKRIFCWMIFPLINLWVLFTIYTRQVSVEFSAVYMAISRTLWAVGLSWIVIACCTGNAQMLQKFLSFRGFVPLSRLTYCAYLLNPVVATMTYLGSETVLSASISGFALTLGGVTLMTFYMSFLFSVMVESPFILLTKMAFKRITRKRQSEPKPVPET